ncbi:MAG: glycosyltransferase family 4 protein [Actinomycetia bacterium]|nr:glycosyltransferase family 4 protein [Actinomycetes bacterium]
MKKILYISTIPSPYRVDFYNELGKYIDLTVWFAEHNEKINREWKISEKAYNYNYEILKGITIASNINKRINYEILFKLNREKFDVYIVGGYALPINIFAIWWLNKNNIPFILSLDGGFYKKNNIFIEYIKKKLIFSATLHMSSGKNCTNYLQYYNVEKDKILEYPFSSVNYTKKDLKPLSENEITNKKNKEGLNKIVLLTIGQFIPRKGINILLKAYKDLNYNNVSLLIIGGGSLKNEYLNYIKKYNIRNVIIKNFLQKDELVNYYKISDIFILPTTYDIWGLVINEAMSFGLPIITTNKCGSAIDLVKEEYNGYIFKVNDVEDLNCKLKLLIENKELRKKFSLNSKTIIIKYTIKNMVKKYLDAINFIHNCNAPY